MKKRIKKLWVDALESGKYSQCNLQLKKPGKRPSYCCLGVLCQLYAKEHKSEGAKFDSNGRFHTDESDKFGITDSLPPKVIRWAGLSCDNPHTNLRIHGNRKSLIHLNDEERASFKQIAKEIRKFKES